MHSDYNFFCLLDLSLERSCKIRHLPHNMVIIDEASKQASNQCINSTGALLTYTALLWSISGVIDSVIGF